MIGNIFPSLKFMASKFSFALSLLLAFMVIFGCGAKRDETTLSMGSIDTTQFQKVDSIPTAKKKALRDTVLTIRADTVRVLYYPNTGREVMKLLAGDVCRITRTGRYDVIEGKGNFWIRVERFGGKGWIFGGQTSLESDVWVFSEGMTESGNPHTKYNLDELSSSNFEGLFKMVGERIKNLEYKDESGSRIVELTDDKIEVKESEELGDSFIESFKPGPETDSIKSINYSYAMDEGSKISFNHTLIAFLKDSKYSLAADFSGELKEIIKVGNKYLFVTEYALSGSRLGNVHINNVIIWFPKKRVVIGRQRFGHSGLDPEGMPIFKPCEDGSFISQASCIFAREDGKLNMQVFETYNQVRETGGIKEKVFFITRYFTFNESVNRFVETKQEVLYVPK